jgi:putative oxidoreductase
MYFQRIHESRDVFYLLFRLAAGLLFMQHGLQKVTGFLNPQGASPVLSALWWFGLFEIIGGFAVAFGFLTRLAALGTAIQTVIIYFVAHATKSINPLANQGEIVVLFFVCFVVILSFGARSWSLDELIFGREIF